jgi:hypothetical protein
MVSLVDILDIKKTVTIRGKEIDIEGINAEKLGLLIISFPEMRLAFAGKEVSLKPEDIIKMGPRIVATVIAAGTGPATEDKDGQLSFDTEVFKQNTAAAGKLSIGEQITLITAIFEKTFPDGFGPFVESLKSLGFDLGASADGAFGWGQAMNSHAISRPSAPQEDSNAVKSLG